jgi:lysophospholipase L1-like esterase
MELTRRRRLVFWVMLTVIALTLSVSAGEVMLRIIYRDGGRTTLAGPGSTPFEYLYPGADRARSRRVPDHRTPGVRRLLVFGDSITWGVGVRDWRDSYTSKLLDLLNADGRRYDMQVNARPGTSVDSYARWAGIEVPRIDPDLVIYQWDANDLEIGKPHPIVRRSWREWPTHPWLMHHSYLYYFLDRRSIQFVPPRTSFYTNYLLHSFEEGTTSWARYRDSFHRWAVYSTAQGARALVVLYPQVPFRGANPLATIHARMKALAGRTELRYPAVMFRGEIGETKADSSVTEGRVRCSHGEAGALVGSGPIPLLPGSYDLTVRVRLDSVPSRLDAPIATLDVLVDDKPAASLPMMVSSFPGAGVWTNLSVRFSAPGALARFRWELRNVQGTSMSIDTVSMPVTYPGLYVIDLSARMNTFDTHASIFDAHPNEHAHQVMAEELADWIRAHDRSRAGS